MWEFANPVRLIWDSPDGVLFYCTLLLIFQYRCGRAASLLRKAYQVSTPPDHAKNRRGVLLLMIWMPTLVCRTWGSLWGSTRRLSKLVSTLYPVGLGQRGTLFLGGCLRCFSCRRDHGRRRFVCPKNDTSLVFCFRWRGVRISGSVSPWLLGIWVRRFEKCKKINNYGARIIKQNLVYRYWWNDS